MIPILFSVHALATILVVTFALELDATPDVVLLVAMGFNGVALALEALAMGERTNAFSNRRKRPDR